MTASDDDSSLELAAQRVLSDTRRVFSPSDQDAERVRGALRQSLLTQTVGVQPSAAPRAGVVKLTVSAAVIAISAGVGYVAGYRAGSARPPAPVTAPIASAPRVQPGQAAPKEAASPPSPASDAAPPPPAAARNPVKRHAAARSPAAIDSPPSAATAETLALELNGVRRVERALRDGQPRMALSILDELDRTVPDGQLKEERLAAFTVARCSVGLGSPQLLRQQFTSAYPDSVYSTRVTQACSAKADP